MISTSIGIHLTVYGYDRCLMKSTSIVYIRQYMGMTSGLRRTVKVLLLHICGRLIHMFSLQESFRAEQFVS